MPEKPQIRSKRGIPLAFPLTLGLMIALGSAGAFALEAPTQAPSQQAPFQTPPQAPIVDLHAHLFFYEGIGLESFVHAFWGGFEEPLTPHTWSNRFFAKVNAETLDASGSRIVVIALYAHPLFPASFRDSIRMQIQAAESFVKTHSNWAIAHNSQEATRLNRSGKKFLSSHWKVPGEFSKLRPI